MSKNNDSQSRENAPKGAKNKTTTKIVNKIQATKGRPVLLYVSAFVMLLSVISIGYYQPANTSLANTSSSEVASETAISKISEASLDEKLATDIAASFAVQTKMPVASNVANLSISLEAQKEMSQTSDNTIAKPQIIQADTSSRGVITHTAKQGETVLSIADQYHISAQTVRWANDLDTDNVEPGRKLTILPVNGVLYTVKADDTVAAVAQKYASSAERIVAFNDLEMKGIAKDMQIVIPDGNLPEVERPGYVAPVEAPSYGSSQSISGSSYTGGYSFGNVNASVGNRYAFGNCTWYAFERRAQLGRPIGSFWGDGGVWAISAAKAGFTVNTTPAPGAIAQWNRYSSVRGVSPYYGHVGIVERVNPDGTVTISEMNVAGFNVVSSTTIPASNVDNYIH